MPNNRIHPTRVSRAASLCGEPLRVIQSVQPGDVGHFRPNSQSLSAATPRAIPATTKDQMVLRRAMACALRSTFSWSARRRPILSLMSWREARASRRGARPPPGGSVRSRRRGRGEGRARAVASWCRSSVSLSRDGDVPPTWNARNGTLCRRGVHTPRREVFIPCSVLPESFPFR